MTVNDPAAHNEAQRRYFEQTYKPRMVPRDTPYLNRQVDEVLALTGLTPGDRVLEVGCGMGRYTLLLAARGIRVEGLDIAPAFIEHAKAEAQDKGLENATFKLGSFLDFEPEGQFDLILLGAMLVHVDDPELLPLLLRMKRALRRASAS